MNETYSVVMTGSDSKDEIKKIARKAIEDRFAACAQIMPIESVFMWEGKVDEANEYLLLLKTVASQVSSLKKMISENHSYEVPEIIVVPIVDGSDEYLGWMSSVT